MARSLTVQPEEQASRSALLTGFLIFAVAWLAVGAMAAAVGDTAVATPDTQASRTP
ncbi:MAG: hypothetical protein H6732_06400 [Alphaproteobacteria bacterium]|nr:hypothetical protein [Alphaproteobacteria bacterium]